MLDVDAVVAYLRITLVRDLAGGDRGGGGGRGGVERVRATDEGERDQQHCRDPAPPCPHRVPPDSRPYRLELEVSLTRDIRGTGGGIRPSLIRKAGQFALFPRISITNNRPTRDQGNCDRTHMSRWRMACMAPPVGYAGRGPASSGRRRAGTKARLAEPTCGAGQPALHRRRRALYGS